MSKPAFFDILCAAMLRVESDLEQWPFMVYLRSKESPDLIQGLEIAISRGYLEAGGHIDSGIGIHAILPAGRDFLDGMKP